MDGEGDFSVVAALSRADIGASTDSCAADTGDRYRRPPAGWGVGAGGAPLATHHSDFVTRCAVTAYLMIVGIFPAHKIEPARSPTGRRARDHRQ